MASYPGPKTKRPNRRKLGRGQHTPRPSVIATPTATLAVVVITFNVPVVVNGNLNLNLSTQTLLSQVVDSATQITQTYSSTVIASAWRIDNTDPSISSMQGGTLASASGTF